MNRLLMVSVVLVLGVASARADFFVIDDFQAPSPAQPYQIALLNGNPFIRADALGNGGTRTFAATVLQPLPPDFDSVTGQIGNGLLRFNTESATTATAKLSYTGLSNQLALTEFVQVDFLKWDSGNSQTTGPIRLTFNTGSGDLTADVLVADSASPFSVIAPLSSFSGSGNIATASSLELFLNGPANSREATDIRLNRIGVQQVPAPVGLLALVVSSPILLLIRRRMRKAAIVLEV